MAVRIRLTRVGGKKKPYYRIVAANSESPRDGRFLEIVGTYDPHTEPASVKVDSGLLQKWLERGATCTDTVANLLKDRELMPGQEQAAAAS
jgi:small subunit ribosomal protein S16